MITSKGGSRPGVCTPHLRKKGREKNERERKRDGKGGPNLESFYHRTVSIF